MKEDRKIVYFARFCQLIYSHCTEDEPILASDLLESFKLAKRAFTDLLNADNKKAILRPLRIPLVVKQALVNADVAKYSVIYPDVPQPQHQPQPQPQPQP